VYAKEKQIMSRILWLRLDDGTDVIAAMHSANELALPSKSGELVLTADDRVSHLPGERVAGWLVVEPQMPLPREAAVYRFIASR
jgi:hypothetical protein